MSKMYVNGWRSRTNLRILRSSLQVRRSRRRSTWATAETVTKSHIVQFLKDFGGLDQEKAVAMYHSLSDGFKTHRGRLQSAHAATYCEVPDHVKRTEWKTFEENVKYINNTNVSDAGSSVGARSAMSRMDLTSQRGASPAPTLQTEGSFMSITNTTPFRITIHPNAIIFFFFDSSTIPTIPSPQESDQPTTASPSISSSSPALPHQPTSSPSAVLSIPSSVAPPPQQPTASHTVRLQQVYLFKVGV
ncbi:hypothetical protein BDB00DRAFT_791815 [Zychaea mexicana]|uniref:uncharacterized protein n=1 Tax=Zychaea mexicana TaxID=64656 RepID=UPI0022FDF56A|nr:uncharacterized protein BDB00DRAFT_791815 [Zychaea mexicana]KAI9488469.1 hypothetical protein BDB00DRAFT_791815 [Zychaea mexicana]